MPASSPEEIEKLCKRVISGEFQDEENIETASQNFGVVICSSFKQPSDSLVSLCSEAMLRCLNFPEYKDQAFCSSSIEHCIVLACARAQEANNPEEIPLLLSFIVRNFTFKPSKDVILFLGNNLSNKDSSLTLIKLCLEALSLILEVQKSSKTSQSLLVQKLLPLHSIQGKISPTQSLLGEFHRELTLCVAKTSSQVGIRGWEQSICDLSTSLYPNIGEGNSPKEVLILHELETLLTSAGEKMLSLKARACLCTRLLSCIQSLHGMVCERALSFWKSDLCFQLLQGDDNLLSKTCEASLVKASLEHW